jgi:hypothetical protein
LADPCSQPSSCVAQRKTPPRSSWRRGSGPCKPCCSPLGVLGHQDRAWTAEAPCPGSPVFLTRRLLLSEDKRSRMLRSGPLLGRANVFHCFFAQSIGIGFTGFGKCDYLVGDGRSDGQAQTYTKVICAGRQQFPVQLLRLQTLISAWCARRRNNLEVTTARRRDLHVAVNPSRGADHSF